MAKLQTSPGNAHPPSRLCPPHLRPSFPYRYRTLKIFASSSSLHASYAISVRRTSALPAASFRFHLTMDTLAVRLTIPPVGFVGDFHSQVSAPCRAHKAEGRRSLLRRPSSNLAPQVGLEPTTLRLTAECSAIELLRNNCGCSALDSALSRNGFYNKRPRAWSR